MSSTSRNSDQFDDEVRANVESRSRRLTILAFVVFAVTIALTFWAWRSNQALAKDRARIRLQQEIDRTRANLRMRLIVYEDALYGTRSLFDANRVVTREMFRAYISSLHLEERYPGIQGIGYAELIPRAELAHHIAGMRRQGFPDYTVRPDGDRPEYTSIIYLEPFNWRNQRAFGYDMYSDQTRRAAMDTARDTGGIAITGKVTLVQETDQNVQPGFLMYLPLYRGNMPRGSIEERRAALQGYIYSPFRMGDLMSEIPQESSSLADFEIYSGHEITPSAVLYREPDLDRRARNYRPEVVQLSELSFGGQTWTVHFSTTPNFDALVREAENHMLLPSGFAISLLLFGIIMSAAQTQNRAVRLADRITAKLRESEERIRAVTQTATDAIISADSEGAIVYFNPAAERIFGYAEKDAVGKPITTLMPKVFDPSKVQSFEQFLKSGLGGMSGQTIETTGRRADGSEFPVGVSLSTWGAADALFFTGIVRDITDRKAAETNIMKLNEELTEALFRSDKLAVTGRLMATIAHEINNPLAALTNLLFVLESEKLTSSAQEFVRMAQEQVTMLTNISQQTLTPYRVTQFPSVTNISELLDDVLAMLRPKLLGSHVHVIRQYPALVEMNIYPSELRQVFTNVISNAIDAMPDGGNLTLKVVKRGCTVEITVADTGMGIAPQDASKLFEPFFTTKGENGTGVGLWVVKEILNRIGGTIRFSSSTAPENHGTEFVVSLPVELHSGQEHQYEKVS